MKKLFIPALLLFGLSLPLQAKELAGITVADSITSANQETLLLNGMGLREKLWIDVYVGSLYLVKPSYNVADILSWPNAFRIQLDFIYSEVTPEKLLKAWKEGFEKNQTEEKLKAMQTEIARFYGLFKESAVKGDRYTIDYVPASGISVRKNDVLLGIIQGEDFRSALLEIWLGNHPADKQLKKGMLGLD